MRMLAFSLLLTVLCASAAENVFFVAPNGNDRWSGTRAEPAAEDGPFATLQRALDAAASKPGARIVLTSGFYPLSAPLQIGSQHSGLTITAAQGKHPVISGGRVIRAWRKDPSNPSLWKARVADAQGGRWEFRQLFVDGKRKSRARTPNNDFFRIDGATPQDKPVKIHFKPGDIRKEWADRGDVELIALLAWSDIRMQIRAVDEEKRIATLSGDPRPSNREENARYWLENAPEFLDSPGEWYLDPKSGEVSYWAEPGEDLTTLEVIAPVLDELLVIRGEAGNPVRDLAIRGLEFSHTSWSLGPNGYADTQAAVAVNGEIRAEYAENVRIENCRFSHLAGYAIELGRGAKRFTVSGNEMVDLGAGAIRLGETRPPGRTEDENNAHSVTDNHMHRLGRVYPPAVGVFILQSGSNRIAHNQIHDLYYTAISVGWNWGYRETPCRENIIEFNHLHDVGQNWLSDMGAVYTLGPQKGTVIRNNLIHDVSAFTYGGWGLYTDEGSSDIVLENNVVYRCKSAGFHQHYGKENVVRNNIFAFNKEHQLMRTRPEPHISFIFTNNIVYFDSGDLLGSNWSNDHYVMDRNVYYDVRLADQPEKLKFAGGTLDEWRKRGHDRNSVIADPMFVAPEKHDFSLRESSPALKLGFKPIDLSEVGVRRAGQHD